MTKVAGFWMSLPDGFLMSFDTALPMLVVSPPHDQPKSSSSPPFGPAGEALRLGDRRVHHHRLERVLGHAAVNGASQIPATAHRR